MPAHHRDVVASSVPPSRSHVSAASDIMGEWGISVLNLQAEATPTGTRYCKECTSIELEFPPRFWIVDLNSRGFAVFPGALNRDLPRLNYIVLYMAVTITVDYTYHW